ncbi:MAG: Asp-tRNA(Asn)/Glu-tRNA(Gln) amidotransferase subunit GatC [Alphaproteobacteria bacterium]|jgi:aspartyl-tRNA(Asn)/glutamyl-tRNA(Gln) amidotransferase subunit C|nr:Asp-tRNA(Asn)/Glu-tRNA(Gln) amidotransferase GatCAB subunit C [Rhodospirillaceae bacterium]MDP6304907.1 Asp-tRNA(Asn)/Glu-tRNA(Gln) amidotransferase subunit GatC [Alphaproteobacteria bacterium]MDP6660141.1 Asp-tRNA(Asn)/Glu-tRNA(Gln) amidotransferase subunit GatC [Alphaproteobacteria bacterium]MDP6780569.1 Asp-tRNA(Asn)/Glu-tRNA(Gln) amidotransferase subunit GatC [Alphaproteobacteria bacterium]MDP7044272.1 Asp-tRNA(Asn)/Glu-tRNA(Gln) amidotransferase subunit GatC [Alphaproteobacteria bacteri|tara:strand:- start:366 stop:653 length:288 start_codon:yes stop_codon:yes gene_type:complete
MPLDKATVARIATLARIRVPEEELESLAAEMDKIIGWVEQLDEVTTDDVPPMASVVDVELPWRDDEVTDGDCRDKVLANAPEKVEGFFAVSKVLE